LLILFQAGCVCHAWRIDLSHAALIKQNI
jgi:hypothetical protein